MQPVNFLPWEECVVKLPIIEQNRWSEEPRPIKKKKVPPSLSRSAVLRIQVFFVC